MLVFIFCRYISITIGFIKRIINLDISTIKNGESHDNILQRPQGNAVTQQVAGLWGGYLGGHHLAGGRLYHLFMWRMGLPANHGQHNEEANHIRGGNMPAVSQPL